MISLILDAFNNITKYALVILCVAFGSYYLYSSHAIESRDKTITLKNEQNTLQKQLIIQQKQQYETLVQQYAYYESQVALLQAKDAQREIKLRSMQNEIASNKAWINANNVIQPNWLFFTVGESMSALSDAARSINAAYKTDKSSFASRTSAGLNEFINQCYAEQDRCNILRETIKTTVNNYNKNLTNETIN
jgi:hypothetical protein